MDEIGEVTTPSEVKAVAVSDRKLTANRRNARNSTGPRTAVGKERTRWNALKHGLLAQTVTVDGGFCAERRSEFDRLHEAFREELGPIGPLEEVLVERIVTCYWRLRRAQIAEIGETRKHLDMSPIDPTRERRDKYWREKQYPSIARERLGLNFLFIEAQIDVLEHAIEDIDKKGRISDVCRERLVKHFGFDEDSWIQILPVLQHMADHGPLEGEDPKDIPSPEECRDKLRAVLVDQKTTFEGFLEIIKDRDKCADEAYVKTCHLPDKLALDKILRYETTIDRQMYRALDQLERLQRLREGEAVPPPLALDVNLSRGRV